MIGRPSIAVPLLVAACVAVTIPVLAVAQPPFEASDDPGTIVIQLVQHVGIESADLLQVRIYGDGRVLVHFPVYMTRAGDYTLQLSPEERDALLQIAVGGGLVEFDGSRVRNEVTSARQSIQDAALQSAGPVTLSSRSDPALRIIDLRLASYTDAGGTPQRNVEIQIMWAGAQADAQDLPGVSALQSLAAFERSLLALIDRPELVRTTP